MAAKTVMAKPKMRIDGLPDRVVCRGNGGQVEWLHLVSASVARVPGCRAEQVWSRGERRFGASASLPLTVLQLVLSL